jgi:hypothetical protein
VYITSNTFYKCTATFRTQVCRKYLWINLNGFRPVYTFVYITSNTFYKCTASFRTHCTTFIRPGDLVSRALCTPVLASLWIWLGVGRSVIRNNGSWENINLAFVVRRKPVLLAQVSKVSDLSLVEQIPFSLLQWNVNYRGYLCWLFSMQFVNESAEEVCSSSNAFNSYSGGD